MKTTIPTQKLKDMNVFVAFKRYISIQISIVTRDNTADALDFYVENARSILDYIGISITYYITNINKSYLKCLHLLSESKIYAFNTYKKHLIDNHWKVASILTPIPPSRFA